MTARQVRVDDISSPPGGVLSVSGCRDLFGRLYAAYHDTTASPAVTKVYTSTDDGVNWSLNSWEDDLGTGANGLAGGDKPILLVDASSAVWLVMRTFDGGNPTGPHVIKREPDAQRWAGHGFFQYSTRLSTKTVTAAGATMAAAIDPARTTILGPNVVIAFQDSGDGKIYVAEVQTGNATHKDLGTGTEPRLCFTSGGTSALAFRNGTAIYYTSRAPGTSTANWPTAVDITDGGDTVASVEAITIDSMGQPAALYRYDKSGTNVLKLVEYDGSAFTYTEVTDGTDRESEPGASLAIDSQGSVFVIAVVDTGGGTPVPVRYEQIRALGQTSTWTMAEIEASATATSQDTILLHRNVPSLVGYKPMQMLQSAAGFYLKDDAQLWWYVVDPYPGVGSYPTIFSTIEGDPPYRAADTETRTHYTLTAEGSPATDFPSVQPQMEMRVSQRFETSKATFEAGYKATIAKYHTGRRSITVNFAVVDETDKDTLVAFLDARMADQGTFNFTLPEDDEEIPVFIIDGRHQHQKIGPSQWSLGEFLLMESVTP